jgi:transposase InsO family protein
VTEQLGGPVLSLPSPKLFNYRFSKHPPFLARLLQQIGRFDPQEKVENWRRYYNEERPHGEIGNKPPILLQSHAGATSPPP